MNHFEDLRKVIFLDIETVPCFGSIEDVPEDLRSIWLETHGAKKSRRSVKSSSQDDLEIDTADDWPYNYGDAGLHAEFGRVICVSLGRFEGGIDENNLLIHSLASDNEREILTELSLVLKKYPDFKLCAHNGKGFDFPFLGRRYLINQMSLPAQLNLMGKKPWDVPHIDTMELWAFGARNSPVKLKLLCAVFGLPCPKDDIDGSMVKSVYYGEKDLPRIVKYCEKDVRSLANVYKKICGL